MKVVTGTARAVVEGRRSVWWITFTLECAHRVEVALPVGRRMGGEPTSDPSLPNNKAARRLIEQKTVPCIACGGP